MSATHQVAEITELHERVSMLVDELDTTLLFNRRLVDRSNKERHLLEKALVENRSLKIDLESARWSLQQLQARSTPERTVAWFQSTPGAPKKTKRTRDVDALPSFGSSRAERQVRVAAAMKQWQARAPVRSSGAEEDEDKYRFVTHRKTEEAARQAEYAEFY